MTDLSSPATGVQALSDYVPGHLKDGKGYIVQNSSTLGIDAAGPRVYALGDMGTYSDDGILGTLNGVPVFRTSIKRDLRAVHSDPAGKPWDKDRQYVAHLEETQLVPVGQSKGVGAVFGWEVAEFSGMVDQGQWLHGRQGRRIC